MGGGVPEPVGLIRIGGEALNVLADVGLLRIVHKTITLVQPQALPFARRPFDVVGDRR